LQKVLAYLGYDHNDNCTLIVIQATGLNPIKFWGGIYLSYAEILTYLNGHVTF